PALRASQGTPAKRGLRTRAPAARGPLLCPHRPFARQRTARQRTARSPRQRTRPHQKLVDRPRALPSLANRPDDERLPAPYVSRREHLLDVRAIAARAFGGRARVAPRVALDAEGLEQRGERRDEA